MVQKAVDPEEDRRKREARRPLAARLIQARERAGFTNRTKFADKLPVAPNTVYRIERCDIAPSVATLASWARVCGVSVDELLESGTSATAESADAAVKGVEAAE